MYFSITSIPLIENFWSDNNFCNFLTLASHQVVWMCWQTYNKVRKWKKLLTNIALFQNLLIESLSWMNNVLFVCLFALLLNEGIPRAYRGKKLRLKNILLFPSKSEGITCRFWWMYLQKVKAKCPQISDEK